MSLYALQKLLRDVNRRPDARADYMKSAGDFAARYDLTPAERDALLARDWGKLYALGVHGLLLRPFTLIHQVAEPDYLRAIRGEGA